MNHIRSQILLPPLDGSFNKGTDILHDLLLIGFVEQFMSIPRINAKFYLMSCLRQPSGNLFDPLGGLPPHWILLAGEHQDGHVWHLSGPAFAGDAA